MRRLVLAVWVVAAGCSSPLPEAGSPGALVFTRQCGGCHRVYSPGSMTWPMWEYQLGRMKVLFSRLHRPWLSPEEERLMVDYLQRHAGGQA